MATATDRMFGKSIKRREDPRFITGRGNYTDDLKLAGLTYAAFVRSPHAHARIRSIDVSAARAHPGVVQDLAMVPHMPLTSDVARHVGDPVAVVIADSQDAATDAAEKVVVDWEPLPSVTATERAAQAGASQLHAGAP